MAHLGSAVVVRARSRHTKCQSLDHLCCCVVCFGKSRACVCCVGVDVTDLASDHRVFVAVISEVSQSYSSTLQ